MDEATLLEAPEGHLDVLQELGDRSSPEDPADDRGSL